MISEIAKNDLKRLRENGFNPTDEEIIKLNDIGIRIEAGKQTTPANHPRIGFAGNIAIHEPTIGGVLWYEDFGKDSARSDKTRMLTYLFMLAHCRNLDYLTSLEKPEEIQKCVKKWSKTVDATEMEIWRAILWVKFGEAGMDLEEVNKIKDDIDNEDLLKHLWMTVIAASGNLGVKPEDLMTQTQSNLLATLIQSNLHAHMPMKMSVADDYMKYMNVLNRIEKRCREETQNG